METQFVTRCVNAKQKQATNALRRSVMWQKTKATQTEFNIILDFSKNFKVKLKQRKCVYLFISRYKEGYLNNVNNKAILYMK